MTEQQFNEITKWQKETFGKATPISKLIHLAGPNPKGEIEELINSIGDEDHTIDHKKITATRMEFADCFFLLFGSAAAYGMDYQDCIDSIQQKFEINKKRTWGTPDENGVVNHVK
jgi:NTP pyrophosphatase (non-canonical NTP hydrolase)